MKLVIDRSKWLRGEGGKDTSLYRPKDGKMCCLGFYCRSLGFGAAEMADEADPYSLFLRTIADVGNTDALTEWLVEVEHIEEDGADEDLVCNSPHTDALIEVNDATEFTDGMREAFIKETFAKHGVEVEFVDAT
jgi:hypothetical protein